MKNEIRMISARKGVLKVPKAEGANCYLVALKEKGRNSIVLTVHDAEEAEVITPDDKTEGFRAYGPFKNPGAAMTFAGKLLSKGW